MWFVFFFFPLGCFFFLLCGSFELKAQRMGILSPHKAQLSRVSSTLSLTASVKILFSGGTTISHSISTGYVAGSYLLLPFPVTGGHAPAPGLLATCPRVLSNTWRIGRPTLAAFVHALMPGMTSGREVCPCLCLPPTAHKGLNKRRVHWSNCTLHCKQHANPKAETETAEIWISFLLTTDLARR